MSRDGTDHWPRLGRIWDLTGPPLRPGDEDVRAYRAAILDPPPVDGRLRVLLLGVTPELYQLPWPAGTDFVAADHSAAMLELVWPGPPERALREEWTDLSLPDRSRDLALCDGGFHLLSHPDGQTALVASLSRIVAPGGRCVFRLFVPPPERETTDAVFRDLLAGAVPNVNVLKLRLAMALQPDVATGVALVDVHQAFFGAVADPDALADRLGWPRDVLLGIEAYRDSPVRYSFATVAEVADLFERGGGFRVESVRTPSYVLGERCPLVTIQRTGSA